MKFVAVESPVTGISCSSSLYRLFASLQLRQVGNHCCVICLLVITPFCSNVMRRCRSMTRGPICPTPFPGKVRLGTIAAMPPLILARGPRLARAVLGAIRMGDSKSDNADSEMPFCLLLDERSIWDLIKQARNGSCCCSTPSFPWNSVSIRYSNPDWKDTLLSAKC